MKIIKVNTKPRFDHVFYEAIRNMGDYVCEDCDGAGVVEDDEGLVWNCPKHCKDYRFPPDEAKAHFNWFWGMEVK